MEIHEMRVHHLPCNEGDNYHSASKRTHTDLNRIPTGEAAFYESQDSFGFSSFLTEPLATLVTMDFEAQRRENLKHKEQLLAELNLKSNLVIANHRPSTRPPPFKKRKLEFERRPARTSARLALSTRPSYKEDSGEKFNVVERKNCNQADEPAFLQSRSKYTNRSTVTRRNSRRGRFKSQVAEVDCNKISPNTLGRRTLPFRRLP